jgi:hypothetical protein
VKTTLDIRDELLTRAKRLVKREGQSLRAVVEEGLRLALGASEEKTNYVMQDFSVGDPDVIDPLESLTWQDLRHEIYGESDSK